nr:MAG TPA: hypothetical protein [Caudoviricetes sp.]
MRRRPSISSTRSRSCTNRIKPKTACPLSRRNPWEGALFFCPKTEKSQQCATHKIQHN